MFAGARRRRAALRLARWLGPWADAEAAPPGVQREAVVLPDGDGEVRIFVGPGRPHGAVFLVPGLHYAGADDPRLDRFCRILAAAGLWVCVPCLPDFLALRLHERVIADTARIFDHAVAWPGRPPGPLGVMSISFGSLPALHLAAARPDAVKRLLVFGGYADWQAVMRFAVTGGDGVPYDPLNRPVVYMNLLADLPGAPADPAPLLAAWRAYIEATWGRPEMKADGAWQAVARAHGAALPAPLRALFLKGCGVGPQGAQAVMRALARGGPRPWLDPRPVLPDIHCPVDLVHGADDDVIPHTELAALAAAFGADQTVRTWLTGLYGHTGSAGLDGLRAGLREGRILWGVVHALADLG
ncbi:MAG: hypothetical protein H6702_13940 [Myxococcales bacterium]|nr:hypothetical protein [Myxococcales bacterium]